MDYQTKAHRLRLARSPGDRAAADFLLASFSLFAGVAVCVGNVPLGFACPAFLVLVGDVFPWVHVQYHRFRQDPVARVQGPLAVNSARFTR